MQAWQKEMRVQARKYHLLAGGFLSVGFLAFSLADYAGQTYENWAWFLFLRLCIISFLAPIWWLTYRKHLQPNILAYAYILSISFFIIYTQIKSPVEQLGGIAMALAIFCLTSAFSVLWHWINTIIIAFIIVSVNLIAVVPYLGFAVFLKNSGIWNLIIPFCVTGIVAYRFVFIKNEILLRQNLLEKNEEINQQKEELQTQNQQIEHQSIALRKAYSQITDSVRYATRIQTALLPKKENLSIIGKENFVLYQAKDGISGDFYWASQTEKGIFVAVADCTGHGVAGGLMSMLGHSLLTQLILHDHFTEPAEILDQTNQRLRQLLQQKQNNKEKIADGMDIILIRLDPTQQITYATAKRKIWHFSQGNFTEHKGDNFPIGDSFFDQKLFSQYHFSFQKNDLIYLFTDGYADQFGQNQRKFMLKHFRTLLTEIHTESLEKQEKILWETMRNWQGAQEQTDDWLILGIKF